jgi:D-alanine-D-alanine ligase-like ATP-grasp enzyme
MKLFELPYCSDCGAVRVPHTLYKFLAWTDIFMGYLEDGFGLFGERMYPKFVQSGLDKYLRPTFEFFERMHLASFKSELDPRDNTRTRALFDGAKAAGVRLRQFRLFDFGDNGTFVAQKDGKEVVFAVMPRPRGFRSPSLNWMDDKGKLKVFLIAKNIPTAEGGVARNEKEALAIFEHIGPPVITKPFKTSRGLHTTLSIDTKDDLLRAFRIGQQVSPLVIVEKELQGIVHRVTLIGGKAVAVAIRDYPHVIGNGVSSVRELLEKENKDPRRNGVDFYPLDANDRADAQLKRQGLTWDSVPAKDAHVVLNDKVSRKHGTITINITEGIHPDNIALFERIAEVMGDPLIGVDFMIEDMRKSWKEQPGAGLIECNAMPYIDLHMYPYEGKVLNIGKDLWDYVFAHSS